MLLQKIDLFSHSLNFFNFHLFDSIYSGLREFIKATCENTGMNNNTSDSHNVPIKRILIYDPQLSRPYASIVAVVAGIGLLGNLAVVVVALRRKSISRSNLLIAELAGSDLFFAITQLVVTVPLFWTNKWLYPASMCKVLMSGQMLSSMYSVGFILLIAVVRYQGLIKNPLLVLSKRLVHSLIVANLVIGIFSVVPMFLVYDLDPELEKCWQYWPEKWIDSLIYQVYVSVVYLVLPGLVIVIMYTKLACSLRRAIKKDSAIRCNQAVFERRSAENKKAARLVVTIFVAFAVCILPNRLVLVYFDAVDYNVSKTVFMVLNYVAMVPYHFHLAINPVIYSILDRKWRRDIWKVLTFSGSLDEQRSRATSVAHSISSLKTSSVSSSSSKSYGMRFNSVCTNVITNKDDKGRNTSVDMGNSLLAFQQGVSMSFKDEVFVKQC